jgi:hypothetical protein
MIDDSFIVYSALRLRAGFIRPALMAWKLTVNRVMRRAPAPATRNPRSTAR